MNRVKSILPTDIYPGTFSASCFRYKRDSTTCTRYLHALHLYPKYSSFNRQTQSLRVLRSRRARRAEDDSRRRQRLRRPDVDARIPRAGNGDGREPACLFLSHSRSFALTCLHEWPVLERSGARAHLRGRTTCSSAVVVVVVVERARSLSPFLLSFPTRARARARSFSLSLSLLPWSRRRQRARHPGNPAPRSVRRALAALARTHGAGTEREKSGATHSDEPPILCCGRLAGVMLLVCCYGRLGYGITDRVTRRAVRNARGTTGIPHVRPRGGTKSRLFLPRNAFLEEP